MLFDRLLRTADAIGRYADHDLVRQQSERLARSLRSGEITFPQWARLMSALIRPATGERADAVA